MGEYAFCGHQKVDYLYVRGFAFDPQHSIYGRGPEKLCSLHSCLVNHEETGSLAANSTSCQHTQNTSTALPLQLLGWEAVCNRYALHGCPQLFKSCSKARSGHGEPCKLQTVAPGESSLPTAPRLHVSAK